MVKVTMAEEEDGGLPLVDIPVGLGDPVAGIKNDVPVIGLDQHRAGVPRKGVVPAVGPEKRDVHLDLIVADEAKKGAGSPGHLPAGTMNHLPGYLKRTPAEGIPVRPYQSASFSHQITAVRLTAEYSSLPVAPFLSTLVKNSVTGV